MHSCVQNPLEDWQALESGKDDTLAAAFTWIVDDELARELSAPHDRDVVLEEEVWRHHELLQAQQTDNQACRSIILTSDQAWMRT